MVSMDLLVISKGKAITQPIITNKERFEFGMIGNNNINNLNYGTSRTTDTDGPSMKSSNDEANIIRNTN